MNILDRRRKLLAESNGISKPTMKKGRKGGPQAAERTSQADKLLELIAGRVSFFHSHGADGIAYASFVRDDHPENWPVHSTGFRDYLCRVFHGEYNKVPSSSAIVDAIATMKGHARFDGPALPTAVRIAECDGAIYLDLCNDEWLVVEINAKGWRVVRECPVRFTRRRGMLPLPIPERGGLLNQLRPLCNLPDEDQWRLFISWMLSCYRPGRPFPVLAISGEQGSAKSTLARMARRLVDPNVADLRRLPRDERDLMIAASNGWIVAFENLSGLPGNMSDALCALATGGGFATRQLYSDDEEILFDAKRPILLNGIDDVPQRSDLIDRSIILTLPAIGDDARCPEAKLWKIFERIRPQVLGALLDAVVVGLRNLPITQLDTSPRMADFAEFIVAAEEALPWPRGAFLSAYNLNRAQGNSIALESTIITPVIADFLQRNSEWSGTLKALLSELDKIAEPATKKLIGWPSTPKMLGNLIRRIAPNLRRTGVDVSIHARTSKGTPITFRKVQEIASSTSFGSSVIERTEQTNEANEPNEANPDAHLDDIDPAVHSDIEAQQGNLKGGGD